MKEKKPGIRKRYIIEAAVLLFLLIWAVWSEVPFTGRISLDSPKVDGTLVKLVLITDLHSCYYGKNQSSLIRLVEKENPDIVIMSGDIFDDNKSDENAQTAVNLLAGKYPCYYVTGNHEFWSGHVPEIKDYLKNAGVHVLAGDCETINVNGCELDICGVDDPAGMRSKEWRKQLKKAYGGTDPSHVKILASHRPEHVGEYEKYDFDLILSGHAHAGQMRIPFINRGIWAPSQGFLPQYTSGAYELSNGSTLVVSRGLARESTPIPRYFNHPEIVSIEIK